MSTDRKTKLGVGSSSGRHFPRSLSRLHGNEPEEKPMQTKTGILLGAAAIALGAGAGIADPFDNVRRDADRPVCASESTCGQNHTAFQNGYSYGYEDGIAHRQRNDRNGAGAKDDSEHDRGAVRGSYYWISI
jgi:hypothetical protein